MSPTWISQWLPLRQIGRRFFSAFAEMQAPDRVAAQEPDALE